MTKRVGEEYSPNKVFCSDCKYNQISSCYKELSSHFKVFVSIDKIKPELNVCLHPSNLTIKERSNPIYRHVYFEGKNSMMYLNANNSCENYKKDSKSFWQDILNIFR